MRQAIVAAARACAILMACSGAACSSAKGLGRIPSSSANSQMIGWIEFAEGVHIWKDRDSIGRRDPNLCISGALPKRIFSKAKKTFNGQRIRIIGRTVIDSTLPSSGIGVQTARFYKGTRFENSCGGATIFLGEYIEAIDE